MGCPHKPAGKTTLRPYVGGQLFPLGELAAFCCEHAIFEKGYARERQDNVKFNGSGPADFPKISASDAHGRLHSQDLGLTARTSGLLQQIFEYLWFLACSCAVRSVPAYCSERQGPMEQTQSTAKAQYHARTGTATASAPASSCGRAGQFLPKRQASHAPKAMPLQRPAICAA